MNVCNLFDETTTYKPPHTVDYFYGRLLREESDYILRNRGCQDGLFLLRESCIETGSYVLSLCFEKNINNYKIKRQEDGTLAIKYSSQKIGMKFIGPIELINYYQIESISLCTKPTIPCKRDPSVPPLNYLFINDSQFYILVNTEIAKHLNKRKSKISDSEFSRENREAKGQFRFKYEKIVLETLHCKQAWYQKEIDRDMAEKLLEESGIIDGKFLVRGDEVKGFRISLCSEGSVIHYKIISHFIKEKFKYSLDSNEMIFDTIIHLIDYYHRCSDSPNFKLIHPYLPKPFPSNPAWLEVIVKNPMERWSNIFDSNKYLKLYMSDTQSNSHLNDKDDEPNDNANDFNDLKEIPELKRTLFENEENYEYESLPSYTIDSKDLEIFDQLGAGCFGSVNRGIYRLSLNGATQEIPVAIKQLKIDTEDSKKEITKEAELMKSLNNPHIVKFIGICFCNEQSGSSLKIVLELAKLGPLHKYLRTHKDEMSMIKIVKICYQVAVAMEYLSSKGLVHRDLAARNVLLVSEDLSKVSDFL
jgi:serine/threonine protein kinase